MMTAATRWYRAMAGIFLVFLIAFSGTLAGAGIAVALSPYLNGKVYVGLFLVAFHGLLAGLYVRYGETLSRKLAPFFSWAFGEE